MKYYLVPQSDIESLEEARVRLWKLVEDDIIANLLPCGVTDIMYIIANKRYEEVEK